VGSARLVASSGVSGFIRFRYNDWDEETIVPVDSHNATAHTLAFDNTNGAATGVAIANLASSTANVSVVVRDSSGTQIGSSSMALPSNGHSSFTLSDQFASTLNQQGSVELQAPTGSPISVIGIRFPSSNAFTSIPPVMP
jgi:hypothetical protein